MNCPPCTGNCNQGDDCPNRLPHDTEPMEYMTSDDWADWGIATLVAVMVVIGFAALVWVIASAQTGKLVWPW